LAAGLGLAIATPGRVARAQASSGTIILVSGTLTDPFFGAMKRGADDAAHDLGVKYRYLPAEIAGPALAHALQTALASHPSGLAFGDWFPSTEDPLVAAAAKAGLPVVVVNSAPADWHASGAFAFIGQSDTAAGILGGENLIRAGARDVLCVNHAPGAQNLEQRCTGLAKVAHAAGGTSSVLNIPFSDAFNPGKVTQDIRGALIANKHIDAVFTLGSSIATDAVRAVTDQGLSGKVTIGTVDLSSAVLDDVAKGKLLFTIDQQPYLQGYYAVAILAQAVKYGLHLVGQVSTGPTTITKSGAPNVIRINGEFHGVRGAA
jgi:simple sugar transport system substrate-binding protein